MLISFQRIFFPFIKQRLISFPISAPEYNSINCVWTQVLLAECQSVSNRLFGLDIQYLFNRKLYWGEQDISQQNVLRNTIEIEVVLKILWCRRIKTSSNQFFILEWNDSVVVKKGWKKHKKKTTINRVIINCNGWGNRKGNEWFFIVWIVVGCWW